MRQSEDSLFLNELGEQILKAQALRYSFRV